MKNNERNALIVIDVQVDFCSGGALAVEEGETIIPGINTLLQDFQKYGKHPFNKIVATADWHPKGHVSFASAHGLEPYSSSVVDGRDAVLWPDHCIEGSRGAEFYPALDIAKADLIIRKGRDRNMDSYSAFYENDRITPTGLAGYLENHEIKNVFLCGLAFDWCVFFSAMDSAAHGFSTTVIKELTKSVNLPSGYADEREDEMVRKGIKIVDSIEDPAVL